LQSLGEQRPLLGMREITTGAVLTFGITGFGQIASYVLQVMLARWLLAARYGLYVYLLSWATLLVVPASLGFPTALVRFVAEYRGANDLARLKGVVCLSLAAVAAASVSVAVAGSLVVLSLKELRVERLNFLLALWAIPFVALADTVAQGLRSSGRVVWAYLPAQVLRPMGIAIGAWLILVSSGKLTVASALEASLGGFVLVLAVEAIVFRSAVARQFAKVAAAFEARHWLRVAVPLGGTTAMGSVLDHVPVLIIGLLLGPSVAGIYYAAARSAALVNYVIFSVNALAAPAFSALYWNGQRCQLQRLVGKLSHLIFWPSLVAGVLLCAVSRPLLGFFGAPFVAAWPVLVVLALGYVVGAAVGSVGNLMQMTGYELANLKVLGASAAINIALNLLLVPAKGALGAALAGALTIAVWKIWLHALVTRRLGFRPSIASAVLSLVRQHAA
jgi:O-antigen/teichoic acid export membrane protein